MYCRLISTNAAERAQYVVWLKCRSEVRVFVDHRDVCNTAYLISIKLAIDSPLTDCSGTYIRMRWQRDTVTLCCKGPTDRI